LTRLVLASASTTRARLLTNAGVVFDAVAAPLDEFAARESLSRDGVPSDEIAVSLAELKALRVSALRPGAFVIGADQILILEGEIVSRSSGIEEARALLRRLAGQNHELITAAALAKEGAIVWRHVARAEMQMREISEAFLEAYLETQGEAVLGSVGCYHLEGVGAQLFAKTTGDYFAILGLPLLPLLGALRELGALET